MTPRFPFHPPIRDQRLARLLELVLEAHARAARNNPNASTGACLNSMAGSGDLGKAIASAILAIGGAHGPVTQAREVYESGAFPTGRVPGFGNSFHKDRIDPAWSEVVDHLNKHLPVVAKKINDLTDSVRQATRRNLFPNAALFTATTASETQFRHGTELAIPLFGRLGVWIDLATLPKSPP